MQARLAFMLPSSSGLGRQPLTLATRVRPPLGVPKERVKTKTRFFYLV